MLPNTISLEYCKTYCKPITAQHYNKPNVAQHCVSLFSCSILYIGQLLPTLYKPIVAQCSKSSVVQKAQ